MLNFLKKEFSSTIFIKFILAGGFAALVNFISRIGFDIYVSYTTAIILAYITGMMTAFLLNRLFVFETKQSHSVVKQASLFVLINIFAIIQTVLISLAFAYWIFPMVGLKQGVYEISHFIGICVPIFTSYLGHKYFTFRKITA